MKPERWQKVDELFHAALDHEPTTRAAFLDAACDGDKSLRKQVAALVDAHDKAGTFIENDAWQREARALANTQAPDGVHAAGEVFGRYRIVAPLSAGGMGQVYRATDRMGRSVALKVLAPHDDAGRPHLARFAQEAQTVLTLNHPNIVTIYEIGEVEGTPFIASELIEGETLRDRLALNISELDILDIAIQIANALVVAHEKGIVHRDIKPENVMIRADSYVKVVDFGIAKLTENFSGGVGEDALTRLKVETGEGVIIGTACYMSPEQAKGVAVDARTDLWSLGAVLYEMITGHVPFDGETPAETISLILQKEPAPMARYAKGISGELERITGKALTKKREDRYQTARDLVIDLRNLKRKLEVNAEIDRTGVPEFRDAPSASGQKLSSTVSHSAEATAPSGAHSSSAEYIVAGIKRHRVTVMLAVAVMIASGIGLWLYLRARHTEVAIESIAVLPFQNRGTETDSDYLSDGLSESLIYRLSTLPRLKVSPTSSVFRYKGKEMDPVRVGQELGVDAVLSGRIVQRGDNLTISAELLDVRNNRLLWGEQYERKMSELLATQRDIAREIVDKLKVKVGAEGTGLAKHYTENNEAYQLYLKGRFYWNKRTAEALKKAADYFNQAIQKDPGFALPFAGLADCYLIPTNPQPPIEKMPKAKEAALRALELDETLAEAHASLARVLATYEWDWAGAEKEYKRAIELDPGYALGHQWYSGYLEVMGRKSEMIAERKRAQELDPVSLTTNFAQGLTFYFGRNYEQAIEQFQKTLELDPNFPAISIFLPAAYGQQGKVDQAIAAFQKDLNQRGSVEKSLSMAGLGHVFAMSGRKPEALAVLNELRQRSQKEYTPALSIALVYAGLGEKDEAFASLEEGYKQHEFQLQFLQLEPRWDNLRSDPRFVDLTRRLKLPQ